MDRSSARDRQPGRREEGLNDAGFSVARLIVGGCSSRQRAGAGTSGHLRLERAQISAIWPVRGYQDITESTNVDAGVSHARARFRLARRRDLTTGLRNRCHACRAAAALDLPVVHCAVGGSEPAGTTNAPVDATGFSVSATTSWAGAGSPSGSTARTAPAMRRSTTPADRSR